MVSYSVYDPELTIGFYSITKTMLTVMTRLLAKEFKDDKIRVNCICPGLIKTNFSKSLCN